MYTCKIVTLFQIEYKEYIPLSVMMDSSQCLEIIQLFIEEDVEENPSSFISRCLRYGWLLGVTETQIYLELIMCALRKGETERGAQLGRYY